MNLIQNITEQSAANRANQFYSSGTVVSTDPITNTAVVDVGAPMPDGTATYKRVAYSPQQPPQTGDQVTMVHTNVSPHSGCIVAMQKGDSQVGIPNNAQVVQNGGVSTLNGLSNAITLAAGTNVTLGVAGQTITINASIPGGGVTSLNSLTGALSIVAGANITVTPLGSTITIAAAGGAGTLLYANTTVPSGDTVANTTTATFFASSYTVPANSLVAGQVIRINFAGVYSTISSSPGTITFSLYLGTTLLSATVAIALSASQSNSGFRGSLHLIVDTIGSSGTVECQGLLFMSGGGTAVIYFTNTATQTVNTTTADILELEVQWSVANAGNTITLRQFIAELL